MRYVLFIFILIITTQSFSQNTTKDGPFTSYYNNGNLKTSGLYRDGLKEGEWVDYYLNGTPKSYLYFKAGIKQEEKKFYYKSGILKYQVLNIDGISIAKFYYESGNLYYEKGLCSGYYKEYLENGTLIVASNYLNCNLNGLWTKFFDTGEKEWAITYKDGYKHGPYTHYYPSGVTRVSGLCKKDLKSGKEFYYDDEGQQYNVITYRKGNMLKSANPELAQIQLASGVIYRAPIYPGCKNKLNNPLKKQCMSYKVRNFITKNFNLSLAQKLKLYGKHTIHVKFKVSNTGKVIDAEAQVQNESLKIEALRVINMLPKLEPGIFRGNTKETPFSIPIVFSVENRKI